MGREIASCPAHATQTPHRPRPLLRRHHPYSRMFALLSPLVTTLAMHTPPGAAPGSQTRAAAAVSGRRDVLAGAGATAALALLGGLPGRAEASYALYQASQDSYIDRKKTNFVPVATNDKATLRAIQGDIAQKRGAAYASAKAKKKVQYCAGQMASVQPMMENRCDTYGISKADQSTTTRDEFGNMNIGLFKPDN